MLRAEDIERAMAMGRREAAEVLAFRDAELQRRARAIAAAPEEPPVFMAPRFAEAARDTLGPQARGVILAEGDSWFDYPLNDVLRLLEDHHGYEVESVAHKGDRIEDMAFDGGQPGSPTFSPTSDVSASLQFLLAGDKCHLNRDHCPPSGKSRPQSARDRLPCALRGSTVLPPFSKERNMSRPTSQADHLKEWQNLLASLTENLGDLQHLESRREKLQAILNESLAAFQEQAASTAVKQEASRKLDLLVAQGRKVVTFLHAGIREHYGDRSEKLAEFRLKPFRGRRPKAEKPEAAEPRLQPEDAR